MHLDWADGWRNDNGFTCNPPNTTHSDHIFSTLVCPVCRMKLPSEVHATAHRITMGHEATLVYLDSNNVSVEVTHD